MVDQPLPEDKGVLAADSVMDFITGSVVEPAIIVWIDTEVPFLRTPVIHEVCGAIIDKIIEREAALLKNFLDFKIIDGEVASENKAVRDQLVAWNAAHRQGNADAIKKVKDDMAAAVSKLINFT